jgi:hypothetical protein
VFHTLDWPATRKEDISRYFRIPSAISGEFTLSARSGAGLIYSYETEEPGIPVREVEVGLAMPEAPALWRVDGREQPAAWSAAQASTVLVVRGKTAFAWGV